MPMPFASDSQHRQATYASVGAAAQAGAAAHLATRTSTPCAVVPRKPHAATSRLLNAQVPNATSTAAIASMMPR